MTGLLGPASIFWFYQAWQFAFDYKYELLKPVSGKQASYQHLFLMDHGHVGVAVAGGIGLMCCLMALNALWRGRTALPAATLGSNQLWLHPSFGEKPIPYANIIGVRLSYIWNRKEIALIVDLNGPAERNWVAWAWASPRSQAVIRKRIVDGSLFDLARFRNVLAKNAERARAKLRQRVDR